MRWLLWLLAAQLLVDLGALALTDDAAPGRSLGLEGGALVVDAAVVLMLARASELTRVLIRAAAGLGMAVDAWILGGVLVWAPHDSAGISALITSTGLVAASAITWLVLGRDDVKHWVFARWLRRVGADEPADEPADETADEPADGPARARPHSVASGAARRAPTPPGGTR